MRRAEDVQPEAHGDRRRRMSAGHAATLEQDYGVEVIHAWGMTELSPLGTLSRLRAQARAAAG
jgi:long-subunit acyl-CoA synthetase (AMP-forming)